MILLMSSWSLYRHLVTLGEFLPVCFVFNFREWCMFNYRQWSFSILSVKQEKAQRRNLCILLALCLF